MRKILLILIFFFELIAKLTKVKFDRITKINPPACEISFKSFFTYRCLKINCFIVVLCYVKLWASILSSAIDINFVSVIVCMKIITDLDFIYRCIALKVLNIEPCKEFDL